MVFVSVFGALEEPGCSYSCTSLQQSIVRAASSRSSTKPEPKPGGIEIAKPVWMAKDFSLSRETSSLKTPDNPQITVDFSIGKRASAKLGEK